MLENYDYYGPFESFARNGTCVIYTNDITQDTWDSYYNGLLNMFKDGIETEEMQNGCVTVDFGDGNSCELYMSDLFFNLIMWYLVIYSEIDTKIRPEHLYFPETITASSIKKFIDKFFIRPNRKKMDNIKLNNIIDDALTKISVIDQFSLYFANTINLEDDIMLMKKVPEYYNIIHSDLSDVPIEDVKDEGLKITKRAIEIMKNSKNVLGYDHCLADSWRAGEGINPRQYKEFAINIGSKPSGQGGVFPNIINKSFITGGADDPMSIFIDSSTGRLAQLYSKVNVGDSGAFARILKLNQMDTCLNLDMNYDCHSPNFQIITIKNEKFLKMYLDRYYRLDPMGQEFIISQDDKHLIGKTIYLRSPMTCKSKSEGRGVCYKCYGDLAYTNANINIGVISAEQITAQLTQRLLSAKHLLETIIKKMRWVANFFQWFEVDGNVIQLMHDINTKGYYILIDPDNICMKNEDDYNRSDYDSDEGYSSDDFSESYNEYITEFQIMDPSGEVIDIKTEDLDEMFITNELNEVIRRKATPIDNKVAIPLSAVTDIPLFFIVIRNNELSKAMERIMEIINKNSVTCSMDRHQLLQTFIESIIEGGITVDGIHCEIILSNQLRDPYDPLELVDWSVPNAEYQIMTLNQALTNHPSVTISLMYQKLTKTLYNPLTFRKNKPSFMDLFFMEKPQDFLYNTDNIVESIHEDTGPEIVNPFIKINNDSDE